MKTKTNLKSKSKILIFASLVLIFALLVAFISLSTNTVDVVYAAPTAPTGVQWDGNNATWEAVAGVTGPVSEAGYQVSLYLNNTDEPNLFLATTCTSDTSYNYAGYLLPGNTYYFKVHAYINGEGGGQSDAVQSADKIVDGTKGEAPSNIQFAGTTLSWSAVTGADGYNVWISKKTEEPDVYEQKGDVLDVYPGATNFVNVEAQLREYGYGDYKFEVQAYKTVSRNPLTSRGNKEAAGIYAPFQFDDAGLNIPPSFLGVPITPIDLNKGLSGGKPPYTFVTCVGLPQGLSITDGVIDGTPSQIEGAGNFDLVIKDAEGPGQATLMPTLSFGAVTQLPENQIALVSVEGVLNALIGNTASISASSLVFGDSSYSLRDGGYTVSWCDYAPPTPTWMSGEKFTAAGDYEVCIPVQANGDYTFVDDAKSVTTKVNGNFGYFQRNTDSTGMIRYRFGAAVDPAEYTITYIAGTDGTGTMPSGNTRTAYQERPYELLNCGFTATSDGKEFYHWKIGEEATQYKPGDTYVFTGPTDVTAIWRDKSYTITYNPGTGAWIPDAGDGLIGSKIHDMPYPVPQYEAGAGALLTRADGYRQVGWWLGGAEKKESTTPGDAINEILAGTNEDTTLYPVWELETYTSTYDKGLTTNTWATSIGSEGLPAGTKTYGINFPVSEYVASDDTPVERTGYRQVGWSDVAESTVPSEAINQLTTNADTTLYPVWQKTYTVTYNYGSATGYTGYPKYFTVDEGAAHDVITPPTLTKGSHIHTGWTTDAAENEDDLNKVDAQIAVNNDITLNPVWKIKTYNVVYNKGDGEGTLPASGIKTHGVEYSPIAKYLHSDEIPLTRTDGYRQVGWWIGTVDSTTPADAIDSIADTVVGDADGNINLYPVWAQTFTLAFVDSTNANGVYAENDVINIAAKDKSGNPDYMRFKNWTANPGPGVFGNANSANTTFKMPGNAVTVTANYDPLYLITVNGGKSDKESGYAAAGDPVTITATNIPPGQKFKNWQINSGGAGVTIPNTSPATFTMPGNAITVTAVLENIIYTITYNAGSKSPDGTAQLEDMNTTSTYGKKYTVSTDLPLTRNDGYRQTGWSIEGENENDTKKTNEIASVTSDVVLYPVWAKEYTVTVTDGKLDGGSTTKDYIAGETVNLTADTKANKQFTNWSIVSGGPFSITNPNSANTAYFVMPGNAVKVQANYVDTYDVIYHNGTGAWPASGALPNATKVHNVELSPIDTTYPVTKDSHNQIGWKIGTPETDEDSCDSNDIVTKIVSNINEVVYLYPVWKIKTYNVVYNKGDGEGTLPASGIKTHGVEYSPIAKYLHSDEIPLTRTGGYRQVGWWIGETDSTTPADAINKIVSDVVGDADGNINLYPVWAQTFALTFVDSTNANGVYAENDVINIVAKDKSAENKRFTGWTAEPSSGVFGDATKTTTTFTMPGNIVEVTANFVQLYKITVYADGISPTTSYATSDDPITIIAEDREANNKRFTGWTASPDTVELSTDEFNTLKATFTMIGEAVTVTANYIDTYDVVYNQGTGEWGSSGALEKGIKVHGEKFTAIDKTRPLTRAGYNQVGWWRGTQESVNPDNAIAEIEATVNQHVTLYPVWQAKINKVYFNRSGATGGQDMDPQDIATDATEYLNANTYEWPGRTFEGWTKTEGSLTPDYLNQAPYTMGTDASYTLWAVWSMNKYTVTFLNGDGTALLTKNDYSYDQVIVCPVDVPTKAADNTYTYEFDSWIGWTEGTVVKEDVQYTAKFNQIYIDYIVIFFDEDGVTEILKKTDYHYGEVVAVPAQEPTKAADNTYTYAFDGWDNEVVNVAGNANYKATFRKTYIDYIVKWLNHDGSEITQKTYHYDQMPEFTGAAPVKAQDNEYVYTWTGEWDKDISAVTGNVDYKATFNKEKRKYIVTFFEEDGETPILRKADYHYGDVVTKPADPEKEADKKCTYEFAGWDKEVVAVAGNASYTATFTATKIEYTFEITGGTVVTGEEVEEAPAKVKDGDEITITAEPAPEGKEFTGWYLNDELVSTDPNYTYTFDAEKAQTYGFKLEARYGDIAGEDVDVDNPPSTDTVVEGKKGLNGGAIAGIVIACLVVAGVGGFAIYWFVIKKKTFADLAKIFNKKAKEDKDGKAEDEEAKEEDEEDKE